MCILVIRTWQPCLHMRCTATDRCPTQVSSPGMSEYDCPHAETVYLEDSTACLCPVCRPTMVVQRLEVLLQEVNLETREDPQSSMTTEPETATSSRALQQQPGRIDEDVDTMKIVVDSATVAIHAPRPATPAMPANEVLAGWIEHTEARRDAHDARNRGRGAAEESSLATMTNEEVRELLRRELAEDGV